ncbi:MAG TPA: DUF2442 domain-containing protein [Tepidisphaeraceae bacterium]|jgi:hypothetical protein
MVKSATKPKEPTAIDLRFTRDRLAVLLTDDREVSVPLAWYPTLAAASRAKRTNWRLIGDGIGIHWPQLDLDLSIAGLVRGLQESIPKPPR